MGENGHLLSAHLCQRFLRPLEEFIKFSFKDTSRAGVHVWNLKCQSHLGCIERFVKSYENTVYTALDETT